MNTVVPTAPTAPRAPQGIADGPKARRNPGEFDFAATLSETAGEVPPEAGGNKAALSSVDDTAPPPKTKHRIEAKDRRAPPADGESGGRKRVDTSADEGGSTGGPGINDVSVPRLPDGLVTSPPPEPPARSGDDGAPDPIAIPEPKAPPPRTEAARDVLAVLASAGANRPDSAAAPVMADLIAQVRRSPAPAGLPSTARKTDAPLAATPDTSEAELPASVPETPVAHAKVIRQETHFQPIGREAQRLAAHDARPQQQPAEPALAVAASRPARSEGAKVEPTAMAAAPASGVEVPSPAVAVPVSAEAPPAGSVAAQIADGIARAVEAPAAEPASRPSPSFEAAMRPDAAVPVRSIKLQLNPASLGMVTIVLAGGEGDMRVHVEAERAETFGKVEHERSALTARLSSAGYAVTELTVARAGSADTQARDGESRDTARQGGQSGDSAGGGPREGASQSASDQRARRQDDERHYRGESQASGSAPRGRPAEQALPGLSYAGRFRPV